MGCLRESGGTLLNPKSGRRASPHFTDGKNEGSETMYWPRLYKPKSSSYTHFSGVFPILSAHVKKAIVGWGLAQ